MTVRLSRVAWTSRFDQHRHRAAALLADVVERRRRGQRHPIEDFLFDYYRLRPAELLAWHPGLGVVLEDAPEFAGQRWYVVDEASAASVDVASWVARRNTTLRFTHQLLTATAGRPAQFGCFGMHEWAMVHGLGQDEVRHTGLPLRFDPDRTAQVLERVGVRCSHVDAFRFFTDSARGLNPVQLTRDDQVDHDQAGCLHVGMDLYKWAGKLLPLTSSELLLDCFELAHDIRLLDMRASPYDLTGWGHDPVPVETAAGRAEYVAHQREFSGRAAGLRSRLLDVTSQLTGAEPGR